jgi:protein TIF31
LYGEKNHTIVYGAVEASSPIAWNQELHQKLEENLGKVMKIASRPLPLYPLSADRMGNADNAPNSNVMICGPVEMKGIRGSDHRTYSLDITRLTPRDANWVPQAEGGTGQWEGLMTSPKFTKTQKTFIPSSLSDDEWLAAVLRPELLQKFQEKKTRQSIDIESATSAQPDTDRTPRVADDNVPTNAIVDDSSHINQGRDQEQANLEDSNIISTPAEAMSEMNLNVFIPRLCIPFDDVPGLSSQWKKDEDIVREAANHLWGDVLPELTSDIRKNQNIQIPMDGRSLTQFIHEKGINCRYLGRLATLALQEETKDKLEATEVNLGHKTSIERLRMPLCWLELLECEMVARCSKHVLDRYLSESFSVTGVQPLVLVASFLSAIMSTSEEGAADTENRLYRQLKTTSETGIPTTLFFGENDKNNGVSSRDILLRGRNEMWDDINHEIGSRFRYTLTLYNSKIEAMRSRALMIPLLRRVCQRMGIRIAAKNYQVGDKCFCGGSLNAVLMNTSLIFPIAPIDIVNISPMIKHAGFQDGHSFVPYIPGSGVVSSCLHILLPDAKSALDSSQVHLQSKALPTALEVVQEASSMYQKVVESPLHDYIASMIGKVVEKK